MKNIKQELLNDVLTGVMVAATFAAIAPNAAMAQGLASAVTATSANVFAPAMAILSYVSYAIGAVLVVAGIAHTKKHADNPGNNPLGPALGKLGAGAAFLAAPTLIGTMQSTGTSVFTGTASVSTVPGF
jgi:hypothetical protein